MPEKLYEIPSTQWCILRDLYEPYKKEICSYNFLQTCIDWAERCPNFVIKIYVINNDWQIDGTFIADIPKFYHMYCNTLSANDTNLKTALSCFGPKYDYLVFGFPDRLVKAVMYYYLVNEFELKYFKPDGCTWYMLSKKKALQFVIEPVPGYSLRPLHHSNAEKINDQWDYKGPGTYDMIKHLILYNESIGVFDENDNLVGWCMILPLGEIGILNVDDNHRRKGLGNLLMKSLARKMALKKQDSFAAAAQTNIASRSMMEKLGFQAIDIANWTYTPPI